MEEETGLAVPGWAGLGESTGLLVPSPGFIAWVGLWKSIPRAASQLLAGMGAVKGPRDPPTVNGGGSCSGQCWNPVCPSAMGHPPACHGHRVAGDRVVVL
jgi:hypothetical protein